MVSPFFRLAPVFSLFVPFYLLIPRMPVTQVLGSIYITNKSLVYVVGLQVRLYIMMLSGLIYALVYVVYPLALIEEDPVVILYWKVVLHPVGQKNTNPKAHIHDTHLSASVLRSCTADISNVLCLTWWSVMETHTFSVINKHKFQVWMCVSVLSFVLQLLTSSPFMWLLALSGLVSLKLCKMRRRTLTVD